MWGCLLPGGGGVCSGGVVSAPGGGGGIPTCTEADTPHPMDRITDTSKNITLATTSLRPVTSREIAFQDSAFISYFIFLTHE